MFSLKNLTPNNLQTVQDQTTRLIIKTREVEVITEVDTTPEEVIMEKIVVEDMEITIEEIIVDKIQVILMVITTTTILTTTIASDKTNQMMKQQKILEIMTDTLKSPHFLKKFATLVVTQNIQHAIAK